MIRAAGIKAVILFDGTTVKLPRWGLPRWRLRLARRECRPWDHQPPAPFEQVTAALRLLHLVTDCVRQSHLGDLAWKVGTLSSPIAECGAESRLVKGDTPIGAYRVLPQS